MLNRSINLFFTYQSGVIYFGWINLVARVLGVAENQKRLIRGMAQDLVSFMYVILDN